MKRTGPKLKQGDRTPSGQLSRAASVACRAVSPAELVRMREAALRGVSDPMWGSSYGRMHLEGVINASQLEAAKRWDLLARAYKAAIGAREVKAMDLSGPGPHSAVDPASEEGQRQAKRDAQIVADFEAARKALESFGVLSLRSIRLICEDGLTGSYVQRTYAAAGLNFLAAFWGLTKVQAQRRN